MQKLYIKKDIKSQVTKPQQNKLPNSKKPKNASKQRKIAFERGSSRNLLKTKLSPTTEVDRDNESVIQVEKEERSKVVPY